MSCNEATNEKFSKNKLQLELINIKTGNFKNSNAQKLPKTPKKLKLKKIQQFM